MRSKEEMIHFTNMGLRLWLYLGIYFTSEPQPPPWWNVGKNSTSSEGLLKEWEETFQGELAWQEQIVSFVRELSQNLTGRQPLAGRASVQVVTLPLLVKQEYYFLERECKKFRVELSLVCLSLKKMGWDSCKVGRKNWSRQCSEAGTLRQWEPLARHPKVLHWNLWRRKNNGIRYYLTKSLPGAWASQSPIEREAGFWKEPLCSQ